MAITIKILVILGSSVIILLATRFRFFSHAPEFSSNEEDYAKNTYFENIKQNIEEHPNTRDLRLGREFREAMETPGSDRIEKMMTLFDKFD